MGLIIPKCNAEQRTLTLTLQVYYNATSNDHWVENGVLISELSNLLKKEGIETEKKESQSYTKKTQVLSYFGFLEWEGNEDVSRRRITEDGRLMYEYIVKDNIDKRQELLIESLSKHTFGRNVLGCNSDSDLEAPNIFLKSCFLIKDLTTKEFAYILKKMEFDNFSYADSLADVLYHRYKSKEIDLGDASKWSDPKPILALAEWGLFTVSKDGRSKKYNVDENVINNHCDKIIGLRIKNTEDNISSVLSVVPTLKREELSIQHSYITALKTKPFLLLAGISGTGKSQLVKELAFMSCPNKGDFRNDPSTPGNYLMVEVKPNWHDSTELLGYYNALTERYELTPFIRFAYKACQNSSVPFFVCLDEMNLAPVEQYFAEYLSVLESRKKIGKVIQTSPLIKAEVLANCEAQKDNKDLYSEQDLEIINYIKECGLCLPSNLFVIGTVNMDDTTHQFSRKVIDRAFTIEMNGGDLSDMFKDDRQPILTYCDEPVPLQEFQSRFVQANELWEDDNYKKYREKISKSVPEKLNYINEIFKNTPFQVSYRVQNELVLYLAYLIEKEKYPEKIDSLINEAVLAILMEKILPRVQGDEKLLGRKEESVFSKLIGWINKGLAYIGESQDDRTGMTTAEYGPSPLHKIVNDKLQSMGNRLENSFFTNFF